MRWILAVVASCTCFGVATSGTFLPLRRDTGLEYLFVWPGAPAVVVIAAVALVVVAGLYGLVLWTARRWVPSNTDDARAGRWLAPLAALGLVVFGLLPAAPGIGDWAAVVAFFLYDLRWWWALVLGAWTAWRADELVGHPLGRRLGRVAAWSPAARLLFADVLLFTVVVVWAVVTQPTQRFNGAPMGDEPKYLRYCETWYQGRGCDVSSNTLFADTALDAPSAVLHNFVLLGGVVAEEVPALGRDLRDFAANPWGFRWNRAGDGQNGFLVGKRHSGLYQVHQPGMSLILFPGYYLDRSLLGLSPGYQGEFPNDLVMTTTITLLVLGVCAVALFRLLRHALASEMAAWLAAALAMLSFPMSNFAFQFYPEVPAALLVLLVTNYVCFHAETATTQAQRAVLKAGAAGVAAGMLVWMHPRFLVLATLLGLAAMVKTSGRARLAFFWPYAAILLALGAYDYHITGSWMPNALYAASPDERQIVPSNIVDNLISYAVHGTWGLVPYAPWLLAFLPGLVVIGRRQPGRAFFIVALALALGALAAGHALNPAGGTPGRFVVAVVPLLMWPAAVLVRQHWSSPYVRVAATIGAVVSLHTALAYNWSHEKSAGPMIDPGVTGWKPNLAFPEIREYFSDVSQPGYGVFVAIAMLVLLSVVWAYRAGTVRVETHGARRPVWPATAVIIVAVLLYSTAASAALGRWTSAEFLLSDREARRRAAAALVALDRCRVCVTSTRRQVDWTWLEPNPAQNPHIDLSVDNHRATLSVELESDDRGDGFGRMRVDFGDGTTTPDLGIVRRREVAHAYGKAGTYSVVVSVQLPAGVKVDTRRVDVADRKD